MTATEGADALDEFLAGVEQRIAEILDNPEHARSDKTEETR